MDIKELKKQYADDTFMLELLQDTEKSDLFDDNFELTEKAKKYAPLESYAKAMTEPTKFMLKVEGITPEDLPLNKFNEIITAAKGAINLSWQRQREAKGHLTKREFEDNTTIGLKAASFEVDLQFPSYGKAHIEAGIEDMIDMLTRDTDQLIDMDSHMFDFVKPLASILENDAVTGIKIDSDYSDPSKSPIIKKSRLNTINKSLGNYHPLVVNKIEEIKIAEKFNAEVIVYATDTENKEFKALYNDKKITFDCSDPKNPDAWFHVVMNQVTSLDDTSGAIKVLVEGTYERHKVHVRRASIAKV